VADAYSPQSGALICGAAGLLRGRRATTHWSAFHLLPFFGATPVNKRVVADGNMVFAAGGTSGIDGALRVAAMLRGDEAAKAIQLIMQYAPEPPFNLRDNRNRAAGNRRQRATLGRGDHNSTGGNGPACRQAARHRHAPGAMSLGLDGGRSGGH
jgi:transcriptional regulator GlxA family with amidase domain